jgi:hypothetical protein
LVGLALRYLKTDQCDDFSGAVSDDGSEDGLCAPLRVFLFSFAVNRERNPLPEHDQTGEIICGNTKGLTEPTFIQMSYRCFNIRRKRGREK